ncbi:Uncharacterised protein [Vibrio cholerae]|nr:Uncharacterised protein [Vibrio cholerae]CSI78637.1 Uncharacterised protein [Vibrio cholerae]
MRSLLPSRVEPTSTAVLPIKAAQNEWREKVVVS